MIMLINAKICKKEGYEIYLKLNELFRNNKNKFDKKYVNF